VGTDRTQHGDGPRFLDRVAALGITP